MKKSGSCRGAGLVVGGAVMSTYIFRVNICLAVVW